MWYMSGRGFREEFWESRDNLLLFPMLLKILSWNVRGLNSGDKRVAIKSFLRGTRAHVVCLQETKMEELGSEIVREVWGGRFVDWVALPARGSAGGILVCWDSRVVEKEEVEMGIFSVSCLLRFIEDGFK